VHTNFHASFPLSYRRANVEAGLFEYLLPMARFGCKPMRPQGATTPAPRSLEKKRLVPTNKEVELIFAFAHPTL